MVSRGLLRHVTAGCVGSRWGRCVMVVRGEFRSGQVRQARYCKLRYVSVGYGLVRSGRLGMAS